MTEQRFQTGCGTWSFAVIPADIGGYPFPTAGWRHDRGNANPEPYCIHVRAAGSFGGDDMHIYVRDGEQSTCLEIARTLAGATGRLDREASLDKGLEAVLDGREPGDFRVFLPVTMADWLRLLRGQWYGHEAFVGA